MLAEPKGGVSLFVKLKFQAMSETALVGACPMPRDVLFCNFIGKRSVAPCPTERLIWGRVFCKLYGILAISACKTLVLIARGPEANFKSHCCNK